MGLMSRGLAAAGLLALLAWPPAHAQIASIAGSHVRPTSVLLLRAGDGTNATSAAA